MSVCFCKVGFCNEYIDDKARDADLTAIIQNENLKEAETLKYIDNAFRNENWWLMEMVPWSLHAGASLDDVNS